VLPGRYRKAGFPINHSYFLDRFSIDDQIQATRVELAGGHVEIAFAVHLHREAGGGDNVASDYNSTIGLESHRAIAHEFGFSPTARDIVVVVLLGCTSERVFCAGAQRAKSQAIPGILVNELFEGNEGE
jgi:hypothetical protein